MENRVGDKIGILFGNLRRVCATKWWELLTRDNQGPRGMGNSGKFEQEMGRSKQGTELPDVQEPAAALFRHIIYSTTETRRVPNRRMFSRRRWGRRTRIQGGHRLKSDRTRKMTRLTNQSPLSRPQEIRHSPLHLPFERPCHRPLREKRPEYVHVPSQAHRVSC